MPTEVSPRGARALSAALLCEGCGTTFEPRRRNQRHCRPACRARASRTRKALEIQETIDRLRRLAGVESG
jgi:hypothetical protein